MLGEALQVAGGSLLHAAAALAWVPLPDMGPENVPALFSATVFIALAVLVVYLDPGSRVHRAFALFLVLRGLLNLIGPFRPDPDTAWFWERVYPYLAVGIPVAAAYFAVVYRDPQGRSRALRFVGWGLLAGWLLWSLAYAADHAIWGPFRPSPWDRLDPARLLAYLGVALVFALDHARSRPGPARNGLLIVAVSFALYPVAVATDRVAAWPTYGGEDQRLPFLLSLVLAAIFARSALRRDDPDLARGARRALLALAAAGVPAAIIGLATLLTAPGGYGFWNGLGGIQGSALTLAQPLLVTYVLARYQLFDLDLRLKGTLRKTTVVAAFVVVYLLAAQAAQLAVGSLAPFVGVAVAGLLGLFIAPLHRLADRVANVALPRVDDSPGYLNVRKLEVYRAALERAVAAGEPPDASPRLASLRQQLGLTQRDHTVLLHALRRDAPGPPLELSAGQHVLGRYRVERLLGEGAHGRTYLARDREAQPVVLKVLRPDRTGTSLAREARAIAAVRHPSVVELREVHEEGGTTLLAMEYVGGGSLRERLHRGPLGPAEFRRVATDLLDSLGAVHAAGIVHRDVKPSNVLLTPEGRAKLADFGIAHLPGLETTVGGADGSAIGTIPYMSPEQAKGKHVTHRSDLFSAAATLYEAWTGKPYLAAGPRESTIELQMRAASLGPFKAPMAGPRALRAWFAKALDPTPARRFADAAAMREALLAALPTPTEEPVTKG